MSYEPTNWKTGDVVTSAKLNKLENAVAQSGGGTGNLILNVTETPGEGAKVILTFDKSWKEIHDVFLAGGNVFVIKTDTPDDTVQVYTRAAIVAVASGEGQDGQFYSIVIENDEGPYITDNENGYPSKKGDAK